MYPIREKVTIAPNVTLAVIEAPKIARKRKAGQFVILRFYEEGERIPLTIADADPAEGTITVISQRAGSSTSYFEEMPAEQGILDVVGPLGNPTQIEKYGRVACIGGGIGIAPIHPIAQAMKAAGNDVTVILGGRTKEFVILEDWMRRITDDVHIATDDGSYGVKGFVTSVIEALIGSRGAFDCVVAVGPVPMMKAVAGLTRRYSIPTIVSLNAIMVDGTGMCGACRVTVDGARKFTCVDGPEFDGHKVDFDELMFRLKMFDRYGERAGAMLGESVSNPNCVKKETADGTE